MYIQWTHASKPPSELSVPCRVETNQQAMPQYRKSSAPQEMLQVAVMLCNGYSQSKNVLRPWAARREREGKEMSCVMPYHEMSVFKQDAVNVRVYESFTPKLVEELIELHPVVQCYCELAMFARNNVLEVVLVRAYAMMLIELTSSKSLNFSLQFSQ